MVYDNDAGAQYLHGGVDRMRANIVTSQVAYAEAIKRNGQPRRLSGRRSLRPKAEAGVAAGRIGLIR
jgi:hypothetical protein